MRHIFSMLLLCFSFVALSQGNKTIIDTEKLSEKQRENICAFVSQKGWALVQDKGENFIINCSHQDYRLLFSVNCQDSSQKPQFLIEFSDQYRDGSYGGIDFLSSKDNREIHFLLDGKNFHNPFTKLNENEFRHFIDILKTSKILTINVYDTDDLTNQLALNRSIHFKLGNGALLNYPVTCE